MTIEELLAHAMQCLLKMNSEDGDDLSAINTWANAAQAYGIVAQGMIMHAQAQDIAANNERAELQALWRK